jgi:hypothetical protein
MHLHHRRALVALVASISGIALAGPAAAQGPACVFEYRRADNMWANWGRPEGPLGIESITLQPGQKKIFLTDWSHEKLRTDGTTFYGSHLRRAVNRGTGPVQFRVRGPGSMFAWVKALASAASNFSTTFSSGVFGEEVRYAVHLVVGSSPIFQPGDSAIFRHDLAELSCPGATLVSASVAPPPAPPVVLSLTGARTTTGSTVTVTAKDARSGAALAGQVRIGGVSGAIDQPVTFAPCSETFETYQDPRGITRTRTVRVPCDGVVQISGYPDTYFSF